MKPTFSIIIPTYNRAHMISHGIKSVINQTFSSWELIVIDDGSTDKTKDVIDAFNDPRIRYFWQENQERSVARNNGIEQSNGEWICFLDSDDWYELSHLQVFFDAIVNFPDYRVFRTGILGIKDGITVSQSNEKVSPYGLYPLESVTIFAFHHSITKKHSFDPKMYNAEDLKYLLDIYNTYEIFHIKGQHTVNYNLDSQTNLTNNDYRRLVQNANLFLDDYLKSGKTKLRKYVTRKRCFNAMILLHGAIKHNKDELIPAFYSNIKTLIKYPYEYIALFINRIKMISI